MKLKVFMLFLFALLQLEPLCFGQDQIDLNPTETLEYDLNYRTWYDKSGKFSILAKFDKFAAEVVWLRRKDNNKLVDVKIDALSHADQDLLEKIRRDLALNALSRDQKKRLDQYKVGIEYLLDADEKYLDKQIAVYSDASLLSVVRQERAKEARNAFLKNTTGRQVHWHIFLQDVTSERGHYHLEAKDAITKGYPHGIDSSRQISFPISERSLTGFKKGDLLRLRGKISKREATKCLTLTSIESYYYVEIESVEVVTGKDLELLGAAQQWYESLIPRIYSIRDKHLQKNTMVGRLQVVDERIPITSASLDGDGVLGHAPQDITGYQVGILPLLDAVSDYRVRRDEINADGVVDRIAKHLENEESFVRATLGTKVHWHVVAIPKTSYVWLANAILRGPISGGNPTLHPNAVKRGDLIRLKGIVVDNGSREGEHFGLSFPYTWSARVRVLVTEVEVLSKEEADLLPYAQAWFASLSETE